MAKLSVYKTIDRSQLGGKFVPLIQSGVNNYKILASDLGKEYSPGDAIEITDAGVINVNYDPETLRLSGSGLGVKTDAARGVFGGSNGIYIASANSSINITSSGIKVNPEAFAGNGLSYKAGILGLGGRLNVKSADSTINVSSSGLSVYYGSGLWLNHHGRLSLDKVYVRRHVAARAGHGLYLYHPGYDDSALYVQSADSSILVGQFGLRVHTYALIDQTYLDITRSHVITVDTGSVARAITGTGLVTTNGAIGVNVNTSTGIIVKDNKLYLNAGNGLQTANNAVSVKASDSSIKVHNGIRVNTGYGLSATSNGLYVQSADNSIGVTGDGIRVNVQSGGGIASGNQGLYFDSSSINIPSAISLAGDGLDYYNTALYVKSADSSIGVSNDGIKVNAGYGFSTTSEGFYVQSADNSILVGRSGIRVNPSALVGPGLKNHGDSHLMVHAIAPIYVDQYGVELKVGGCLAVKNGGLYVRSGSGLGEDNGILHVQAHDNSIEVSAGGIRVNPGYGLSATDNGLYVQSADNSIDVSSNGIKVDTLNLAGSGLGGAGGLYVMSADKSIGVSTDGIKVNTSAIAGTGLKAHSNGTLYVCSANGFIDSDSSGVGLNVINLYSHMEATSSNIEYSGGLNAIVAKADDGTKIKSLYSTSGISINNSGSIGVNVDGNTIKIDLDGLYVHTSNLTLALLHSLPGKGLVSHENKLSVYADSGLGFTSTGALYVKDKLPGDGLELRGSTYYVKSADSSIDVSSSGIKVNTSVVRPEAGDGIAGGSQSYYLQSSNKTITIGSDYIDVNPTELAGASLYVDSANKTLNVAYGDGLTTEAGNLKVRAEDTTIGVSNDGIKVNVGSGLGVDSSGVCVNTGYGLSASSDLDGLGVKSANNSIGVSEDGIKVNAGYGLSTTSGGIYVKSADNSIGVSYDGIKVNTINIAGDGLGGANNTLYVNSAWLAGHGLMSNASGKLEIYCGSGLALDTSSGKVYVTSAVNPDFGKGLWLASDNDSLLSVYAGSGLMFDTRNRVSVYAGSGLTLVGPEGEASLQVKAGDNNTISVLESGIEVNAGPGLCYAGSLYIQSADRSINVATDGITVNYGDGLFMNDASKLAVNAGSGLQVSEIEKKLTVYAGSGLGFDTYGDSLEVKNADNSISVTSDGIKVAEGFGLPDYSSGITVNQNTEYTADTNCWLYMWLHCGGQSSNDIIIKSIYIDGIEVLTLGSYVFNRIPVMIPCKKGSKYEFRNVLTGTGNYKLIVYKCLV